VRISSWIGEGTGRAGSKLMIPVRLFSIALFVVHICVRNHQQVIIEHAVVLMGPQCLKDVPLIKKSHVIVFC
jgi:hypothetical protein